MSYILEALRKADAERQRGTVPGLNTPTAPPPPALEPPGPGNGRTWGIAAGLLAAAALAGLLAWQFGTREAAPGNAVTLAQAPAAPAPAVPAPTEPNLPSPATPVTAPPAAAPAKPPVPVPAPPAAKAPPPPTPAKTPTTAPATAPAPARAPASAASRVPAKAAAPAALAMVAPEARVPTQNELPEDVRGRLPRLAISGASYSDNPAHRMLIVGGQIYREGEEPAPGLTLEKIGSKEAILNFQGLRYRLGYP